MYGVKARIWTWATSEGGECSHYCSTFAPNLYYRNQVVPAEKQRGLKADLNVPSPVAQMPKLQCLSCSAGLPGLVQAYQSCIQSVQLYGPTNISPIINHVAHFAQQAAQTPTASVSSERLLRVIG